MKILLVGGAVRNLLLGRAVADKDFLVLDSSQEEFLRHFPGAQPAGKTFPVFLVNSEEYSFPRQDSLDNDLLARDFTVNAMALFPDGTLAAHPQALEDIKNRTLRQSSKTSFDDDLLRVYRGARFLAEIPELQAADELFPGMRQAWAAGRPEELFAERVGRETMRALSAERPGRFLHALDQCGCLKPWLAPLDAAGSVPAGPPQHHHGSVLEHTAEVMDRLAGQGPLTVWMGMVHDLGKCTTPTEELPHHLGHESRGEQLASELGQRLRLSSRFLDAGAIAAALHMKGARYRELRPGTRVDLLMRLHARSLVDEFFELVRADTDLDLCADARQDLECILDVHLSPADQNQGKLSGDKLRQLRAQALGDR